MVINDAANRTRADKAESAFTWGVVIYTFVRVIPVWGALRDGNVNPWIFLAIDVGTAWPYAKSMARLLRSLVGRNYDKAMLWSLVLLASFLAPYLYVAIAGDGMAAWVWWVLGLFITIGLISVYTRLRAGLRSAGDEAPPLP